MRVAVNNGIQKMVAVMLMMLLLVGSVAGVAVAEQAQSNPLRDMMAIYKDVLLGKQPYTVLGAEGGDREVYLKKSIDKWYDGSEGAFTYENFCLTDLNADGYPEIILSLSDYFGFELLRYAEGKVYGYWFGYRGMQDMTLEGNIAYSNGADDNGWYQFAFAGKELTARSVAYVESDGNGNVKYFIGEKEVSEAEYGTLQQEIEQQERPLWIEFTAANVETVASQF